MGDGKIPDRKQRKIISEKDLFPTAQWQRKEPRNAGI